MSAAGTDIKNGVHYRLQSTYVHPMRRSRHFQQHSTAHLNMVGSRSEANTATNKVHVSISNRNGVDGEEVGRQRRSENSIKLSFFSRQSHTQGRKWQLPACTQIERKKKYNFSSHAVIWIRNTAADCEYFIIACASEREGEFAYRSKSFWITHISVSIDRYYVFYCIV